tara:strand:+ start:2489 stop:2836 length:348 start_codon:yes stop_codon:yes gene_type:complete
MAGVNHKRRKAMEISAEVLEPQVAASVRALEKLSAKEREKKPNAHFADDYNRLLNLAKEALPEVPKKLWPEEVGKTNPAMGPNHADANYVEIHSYLNQVLAILSQNIEPAEVLMG